VRQKGRRVAGPFFFDIQVPLSDQDEAAGRGESVRWRKGWVADIVLVTEKGTPVTRFTQD